MKINYTLEGVYIVAYSIIPFDANAPYIEITEEDIPYLRTQQCKLTSTGKLDKTDAIVAIEHNAHDEALREELRSLYAWFKVYDEKVTQYNRQIRLYGHSDIDIAEWDRQAEINAARIKEIRTILG